MLCGFIAHGKARFSDLIPFRLGRFAVRRQDLILTVQDMQPPGGDGPGSSQCRERLDLFLGSEAISNLKRLGGPGSVLWSCRTLDGLS